MMPAEPMAEHIIASHSRTQRGIASPKPGSAQHTVLAFQFKRCLSPHFSLNDLHPTHFSLKDVHPSPFQFKRCSSPPTASEISCL